MAQPGQHEVQGQGYGRETSRRSDAPHSGGRTALLDTVTAAGAGEIWPYRPACGQARRQRHHSLATEYRFAIFRRTSTDCVWTAGRRVLIILNADYSCGTDLVGS